MIRESFNVPPAKPGTSIKKAFEDLQKEEDAWRIQRHGTMRMSQQPRGTTLAADVRPQVFLHPWRSVLGPNRTVLIRPGRVNSVVPTIKGVRLDGKISDTSTAGPLPIFELGDSVEPSPELESFVCLQVCVDLSTGKLIASTQDASAVTIVHKSALDPNYRDGGSVDANGLGIEPIACVIWSDPKTPFRIEQIAMHNFHHRFVPPTVKGGRGRHFFWA